MSEMSAARSISRSLPSGAVLALVAAPFGAVLLAPNARAEAPPEPTSTQPGPVETAPAESAAVESAAAEPAAAEAVATEPTSTEPAPATPSPPRALEPSGFGNETIFGRRLQREGFHFHVSFGVGSGPSIPGLYHAMEIGWSLSGYTIALLHTFIQYKDVFGPSGAGPDEIGGFMAQISGPLYFRDLTWKFAAGVGGTVDQPEGEFNANPGFGVHYGVDLHFPIWPKFGPTLSIAAMNVVERGNHHFGAGLALGVTVF